MQQKPPILVTGHHHSATTWVGRILAAAPGVGYIHEPFNLNCRPGRCRAGFKHWYTYVCQENEGDYLPSIRDTIRFRYSPSSEVRSFRSPKDVARMFRDGFIATRNRLSRYRPLIKDPIALLSSPWLADRFSCNVVITVRHPAAFAASIKRREGNHPFNDFLEQPLLMNGPLADQADEIRRYANEPQPLVAQAAFLWSLLMRFVSDETAKHEDWMVVRHEDIVEDPQEQFEMLFRHLQLDYCPAAQKLVQATTSTSNKLEDKQPNVRLDPYGYVRRNTKGIANKWKKQLTEEEISLVRQIAGKVADAYYDESDW